MNLDNALAAALAAAPLVVLSLTPLAALIVISFAKHKAAATFGVSAIGLAASLAALLTTLPRLPTQVAGLLSADGLSFIGTAIVLVTALAVTLGSRSYLSRREGERGDYYLLLLFAALGATVLASASNLATVFLGLELLSVSLYALVAYRRERVEGTKAAFTYLILASVASAFLLFGMALAYYQTGSLELASITQAAASGSGGTLFAVALAMMGVGFAFKLAVAPFHMWALEVYEGASAPVAALIATMSKAAMALPLIRVLAPATADPAAPPSLVWIIAALAGASMVVGNLLALREERVKRMLAGSSIAQVGYVLVALAAGGSYGAGAAMFYLAAYSLATLGAFACVTVLSPQDRDAGSREDFRGLASRRPFVAAVMTASLLSLAGMPLTAGFIGKFMLFSSGLRAGLATQVLAVLLALNSALSLFYYLRLLSTMYRGGGTAAAETAFAPRLPLLAGLVLALVGLAILVLGTVPGPALSFLASLAGR
jgi:NADH-quinone oxidoreductase subunit N